MGDTRVSGQANLQTVHGQQVTKIDQRNIATDSFYDPQGRLTDVYQPAVEDALNSNASTRPHWQYQYDVNGNLTTIIDPQDDYIPNDNNHNKPKRTTFKYEDDRNPTLRTERDLPAGEAEKDSTSRPLSASTHFDDPFGRVILHTDFKGNVTEYVYDDDLRTAILSTAERTQLGRLVYKRYFTSLSAYNYGGGTPSQTVHYTYDSLGRTASVIDSVSGTTTYAYDADGRVTKVANSQGTVHHAYDPATGRLIETWTGPDRPSATNPTSDTLYGYDELGRLASVSSAFVAGTAPATPNASHDRYDAMGQVLADAAHNSLPTTLYVYDGAGNLTDVILPNGDTTHYTFDDLNRLNVETVRKSDNTLLASYDYDVRDDGLRDHVLETRRSNTTGTYSTVCIDWDYDDLGRLKQESRDEGNDSIQNGDDYTADYHYDLAGNRISETINRLGSANDETIDYVYNEPSPIGYNRDDHLFTSTDLKGTTTTVTAYAYDANGSTISKSTSVNGGTATVIQYGYDVRNRLVVLDPNGDDTRDSTTGALTPNTGDTTYVTDDDGDRVSQTTSGQTAQYLVDKQNPTGFSQTIEEKTPGNSSPNISYVIGNDVIGQAKGPGSTPALQYLLYDGHGSTRELLGADGVPIFEANSTTVYAHVDYDAFGNGVGSTSLNAFAGYVSLLYSGERYDSGLGEQYLRARYYDQTIGRFSSFDSFEGETTSPSALHKFVYANQNPLYYVDPTGHFGLAERLVVCLLLIVAFVWGYQRVKETAKTWNGFAGRTGPVRSEGVGGFDITAQLKSLRKDGLAQWGNLSAAQQDALVDRLKGPNALFSWDINEMYEEPNRKLISPIGTAWGTVTVNDRVYWQDEVNYYWYGVILRMKEERKSRTASEQPAIDEGINNIYNYRAVFWGDTNWEGRIAWAKAGYYDDFEYVRGQNLAQFNSGQPYSGMVNGLFGDKSGNSNQLLIGTGSPW